MKIQILALLLTLLTTCSQSPKASDTPLTTLHKLSLGEIVEWERRGAFELEDAAFVNVYDQPIGEAEKDLVSAGGAGFDYYSNGEAIEKVLVRPQIYQDNIIKILRHRAQDDPLADYTISDRYCDSISTVIDGVIERDQGVRNGSLAGDMRTVDAENQAIMVSIFESCGDMYEELTGNQIRSLWFVAQHSDAELMAYYYPWFYEAVERGRMNSSTFALMIDRLLMYHDYPQEYGSQIQNGDLYPVRDRANLNVIRESVGLGPIEEYLARF
ncbi:DUF6624 domain-containing protein [Lewinella sp. 4G2]|uniref:DUF6624 domain-containing protein n=1 Tax=Lewinella sp. 4G2 TaxID=1803372 RepID=UPI0007B474C7|nr:DUF6624 domain-containing protein [Lewinella sp. 4G2]OAV43429.1 hypothetical protein A3850_002475 [Lewinella sp. 4G2]